MLQKEEALAGIVASASSGKYKDFIVKIPLKDVIFEENVIMIAPITLVHVRKEMRGGR